MALEHAQPLDVISVSPLGAQLRQTKSHSLLKTEKLQLMRVVLPAGESMPPHHVNGEVSIQCLEGRVVVTSRTRDCRLEQGQLVVLPAGEPHAVKGEKDASLLVTLLLHQGRPEQAHDGGREGGPD
jgi:quercetin dioxygenase-like cupin family protein